MSETVVYLSVADAYDRWSGEYDTYENSLVYAATQAVAALAPDAAGQAVLEFGCGTGRNLQALKAAGAARLVGLDLSPGMLDRARARDPAFDLRLQDMAAPVAEPDGAFGLILFSLTLEHVADMAAPLREARRLLAPGGQIVIVEIHPYLALGGLAAHFTLGGETVHMPTVQHTVPHYITAARAAGLTVDACREWTPSDFPADAPARVSRRGANVPLAIEFRLGRA
jgi:malonyl-CoA O-methyltransferase